MAQTEGKRQCHRRRAEGAVTSLPFVKAPLVVLERGRGTAARFAKATRAPRRRRRLQSRTRFRAEAALELTEAEGEEPALEPAVLATVKACRDVSADEVALRARTKEWRAKTSSPSRRPATQRAPQNAAASPSELPRGVETRENSEESFPEDDQRRAARRAMTP